MPEEIRMGVRPALELPAIVEHVLRDQGVNLENGEIVRAVQVALSAAQDVRISVTRELGRIVAEQAEMSGESAQRTAELLEKLDQLGGPESAALLSIMASA